MDHSHYRSTRRRGPRYATTSSPFPCPSNLSDTDRHEPSLNLPPSHSAPRGKSPQHPLSARPQRVSSLCVAAPLLNQHLLHRLRHHCSSLVAPPAPASSASSASSASTTSSYSFLLFLLLLLLLPRSSSTTPCSSSSEQRMEQAGRIGVLPVGVPRIRRERRPKLGVECRVARGDLRE